MKPVIIENKIYEIRGVKVMLDFDLAALYEVETKRLNEQVKRNITRFPSDFMFQLSKEEWDTIRSQNATSSDNSLRSQFATSKTKTSSKAASSKGSLRSQIATLEPTGRGKYPKYRPFAFTEHGVTMLASILNSDKAVQMNIAIVRAFIALRQYAVNYKDLAAQIKSVMERQDGMDGQLTQIYEALENLLDDSMDKKIQKEMWKERERIGFKK